nr:MAG TPA: hypothetical protein [Caudoviricetes sp.]
MEGGNHRVIRYVIKRPLFCCVHNSKNCNMAQVVKQ